MVLPRELFTNIWSRYPLLTYLLDNLILVINLHEHLFGEKPKNYLNKYEYLEIPMTMNSIQEIFINFSYHKQLKLY